MQLKQRIAQIENEKFDAKVKVKESKVLQKTIRNAGLQYVNHDIECKSNKLYVACVGFTVFHLVYNGLIELDIDKENLMSEEITARLGRVTKVEMAPARVRKLLTLVFVFEYFEKLRMAGKFLNICEILTLAYAIKCSYGSPNIDYFLLGFAPVYFSYDP